jgi:hypothetical protein
MIASGGNMTWNNLGVKAFFTFGPCEPWLSVNHPLVLLDAVMDR